MQPAASLRSSLFRFLLAGESETKGKSRERIGREQKEELGEGVGRKGKACS